MNFKTLFTLKNLFITLLVTAVVIFSFISNEARKEVYYLCGNFGKGVTFNSIVRQLDTVELSKYSISGPPQQKQIVHNSLLNLFSCVIVFDADQKVVSATYQ